MFCVFELFCCGSACSPSATLCCFIQERSGSLQSSRIKACGRIGGGGEEQFVPQAVRICTGRFSVTHTDTHRHTQTHTDTHRHTHRHTHIHTNTHTDTCAHRLSYINASQLTSSNDLSAHTCCNLLFEPCLLLCNSSEEEHFCSTHGQPLAGKLVCVFSAQAQG